jgi:hypothetical protein
LRHPGPDIREVAFTKYNYVEHFPNNSGDYTNYRIKMRDNIWSTWYEKLSWNMKVIGPTTSGELRSRNEDGQTHEQTILYAARHIAEC